MLSIAISSTRNRLAVLETRRRWLFEHSLAICTFVVKHGVGYCERCTVLRHWEETFCRAQGGSYPAANGVRERKGKKVQDKAPCVAEEGIMTCWLAVGKR